MSKQNKNQTAAKVLTPEELKKAPKVKVEFIKNPTAKFKLCYSEGDVQEIAEPLAKELIDAGFAKKA